MATDEKNIMFENPALLKRLAKYTVQQCFRNTVLEEFHAGTVPDSASGDFSDVVVTSLPPDNILTKWLSTCGA
jgi:hypothetical protein